MKQFEKLHVDDQNSLLISLLGKIAESGFTSIELMADANECTPQDIWREVCGDAGLDYCEPWRGFPAAPKELPPAPGGTRPLSEKLSAALDEINVPTMNKN